MFKAMREQAEINKKKQQDLSGKQIAGIALTFFSIMPFFLGGFLWGAADANTAGPIIVFVGIFMLFLGLFFLINGKKQKNKKRFRESLDLRTYLSGMMKMEGKIDIKQVSSQLGLQTEQFKNMLYNMAGQNLISGRLQGKYFILDEKSRGSDKIDDFMDALDDQFASWEDNEDTKMGKTSGIRTFRDPH